MPATSARGPICRQREQFARVRSAGSVEEFLLMLNAPRGNNITPDVENIIQFIYMPPSKEISPQQRCDSGAVCAEC